MMPDGTLLLLFVTLQRWAEFIWDRRNTRRLLARGAVERGQNHYPLMIAVHTGWLAGLWWIGYGSVIVWPLLAAFLVIEIGRAWVLWSLGRRWTTRIIILPGAPLVAAGPYRLLKHPNYVIVAAEMVLVPLALGLPLYALAAGIVYVGAVVLVRIPAENAALAQAGEQPTGPSLGHRPELS
jgi:methyltransferase